MIQEGPCYAREVNSALREGQVIMSCPPPGDASFFVYSFKQHI